MARYTAPGKCLTQCNVSIWIKTWKSWKVQQILQKQEGGRDSRLLSSYQRNVSDIHATDTFLVCSAVRKKLKNQELADKRGGCSVWSWFVWLSFKISKHNKSQIPWTTPPLLQPFLTPHPTPTPQPPTSTPPPTPDTPPPTPLHAHASIIPLTVTCTVQYGVLERPILTSTTKSAGPLEYLHCFQRHKGFSQQLSKYIDEMSHSLCRVFSDI